MKKADRVIVSDLEVGNEIAIQCDSICILSITEPGSYEIALKNQNVYVKRIKGSSPVNVFVERDICH